MIIIQRPGYHLPLKLTGRTTRGASHHPNHTFIPGHGCGWDVIVPSRWALNFWVAFVYRGGRVGGMRESLATSAEAGELMYPQDFPDTEAGRQIEEVSAAGIREVH